MHVYFANENNFTQSNEQEVSVISSTDNGDTWGYSYRANCWNEMSLGRVIKDEIVVIEDNNIGNFRPYTVRVTGCYQCWPMI